MAESNEDEVQQQMEEDMRAVDESSDVKSGEGKSSEGGEPQQKEESGEVKSGEVKSGEGHSEGGEPNQKEDPREGHDERKTPHPFALKMNEMISKHNCYEVGSNDLLMDLKKEKAVPDKMSVQGLHIRIKDYGDDYFKVGQGPVVLRTDSASFLDTFAEKTQKRAAEETVAEVPTKVAKSEGE